MDLWRLIKRRVGQLALVSESEGRVPCCYRELATSGPLGIGSTRTIPPRLEQVIE